MANEAERTLGSLQEYLEGTFQQEQVSEDDLTEEILAAILVLYLLGAGYEGEGDLTTEDRQKLEEAYQLTLATVAGMVDRHERGVDMQPTINRIVNHVTGILFFAFALHGAGTTTMYVWTLGPTEHCTDCLAQAAKGEMPGSHWKEMAEQNIYPKSPALFCTGLHCQCELQEA